MDQITFGQPQCDLCGIRQAKINLQRTVTQEGPDGYAIVTNIEIIKVCVRCAKNQAWVDTSQGKPLAEQFK